MNRLLFSSLLLLLSSWANAYDFVVDGLCYNILSDNEVELTYPMYEISYAGDITIPSYVVDQNLTYKVVAIGQASFSRNKKITSVSIPNTIKLIGSYAFQDCSSLNSIIIPNSVISIEKSAFNGCTKMSSLSLSNSLITIGDGAFHHCDALEYVSIPNKVESLGGYSFGRCNSLKKVVIPNSIISIAEWAFYDSPIEEIENNISNPFIIRKMFLLMQYTRIVN